LIQYFDVELDIESVGLLIQAYSKKGDIASVEKYFAKLKEKDWALNGITILSMMQAYANVENLEKVQQFYAMLAANYLPVEIAHINLIMRLHMKRVSK
jgi:pentatricopeptide repeat protein